MGEMVLVPALAPHDLANAGSDELRTLAFLPNAAFVSVFDDILSPVESRVLIAPPPETDPRMPRSKASRPTPDGHRNRGHGSPLRRSRWKLSWAGDCLHSFNPTCSHGL